MEVLYSLAHAITGHRGGGNAEAIHGYLQKAFQLPDDKHAELVQAARQRAVSVLSNVHLSEICFNHFKQAPDVVLHLGVLQARHLKGKDVNGRHPK